ncbi:hypothetical protein AK812_SmicGene5576 [Symbiodinium microadriaticum]|uniref:Uncharacterized protein n=1 Tax=Symbiodinium microadriaticum TaxID=2951 RepID=A0A1Q9ET74_SYMMI|nr:hypothetical protein AK812_SmicGene5576 [Symbiodinium microadriaticum]
MAQGWQDFRCPAEPLPLPCSWAGSSVASPVLFVETWDCRRQFQGSSLSSEVPETQLQEEHAGNSSQRAAIAG